VRTIQVSKLAHHLLTPTRFRQILGRIGRLASSLTA